MDPQPTLGSIAEPMPSCTVFHLATANPSALITLPPPPTITLAPVPALATATAAVPVPASTPVPAPVPAQVPQAFKDPSLMGGDSSSPAVKVLAATAPSVSPTLETLATASPNNDAEVLFPMGPVNRPKNKPSKAQAGMNGGRWTEQEHQSFLAGLRMYGREWKKVASKIKTRTSAQIRSHAQKYFAKLARDDEARKQGGGLLQALPQDGATTVGSFGYISDGSSSAASISAAPEMPILEADPTTNPTNTAVPSMLPTSTRSVLPVAQLSTIAPAPSLPIAKSYKAIRPALGFPSKKRSRTLSVDTPSFMFKRSKHESPTQERLPSPEELVAKVSPNLRQRLASLIEAEISALQVLSCYWWGEKQEPSTSAAAAASVSAAAVSRRSPGLDMDAPCTRQANASGIGAPAFAVHNSINLSMPTATDPTSSIY